MYSELHNNFLAAVKELNLKFPVATISKDTGYVSSVVSEYLNSKKEVSEKFLRKFCEVYKLDYEDLVHSNNIKKKWELEAEIISLKAYNSSLLLNLSKWMAKMDPSKRAEDHFEDLVSGKTIFERDLIKNLK